MDFRNYCTFSKDRVQFGNVQIDELPWTQITYQIKRPILNMRMLIFFSLKRCVQNGFLFENQKRQKIAEITFFFNTSRKKSDPVYLFCLIPKSY